MMPPSSEISVLRSKVFNKLLQKGKVVYHLAKYDRCQPKTVLYIVGCQRSGTTLMNEIFERDLNTKVYAEQSKLSSHDRPKKLRLNPLNSVKMVLEHDRAPLIILKPLVESQNILQLLDYIEGSKALWLYRHYKDVAVSNVKKWGERNAINDLKAIIEQQPHNWRFEKVSPETRALVLEHFSEEMNPYDAVALYWFVRNWFVLQLNLESDRRVMVCKYEQLIGDPVGVMKQVYEFLGRQFPGSNIVAGVHTAAINRGKKIELSPQIEQHCQALLERLDSIAQARYSWNLR